MKKRNITYIIIFTLLVLGCSNETRVFEFNNNKVYSKVMYSYKYKNNNILSKKETQYYIFNGTIVDSIIDTTHFEYSLKGLLIKETNPSSICPKIIWKYNINDSLIQKIKIGSFGDTLLNLKVRYTHNRKIEDKRLLIHIIDYNLDINASLEQNLYDTITSKKITNIKNNQKAYSLSFAKGNKKDSTIYVYRDSKLDYMIKYEYENSIFSNKYTTTYYYNKSTSYPDERTLSLLNDTISFITYEFEDENIIYKKMYQNSVKDITHYYYDKSNTLIGEIEQFPSENITHYTAYKYDKKGNLIEEKSYNE